MSAWYDPFGWFGDSETTAPATGGAPVGGNNPVSNSSDPSFIDFLVATVKGDEMATESWKSGFETSIPGKVVNAVVDTAKSAASSIGSGIKSFLIWIVVIAIVGVFLFYFVKGKATAAGAG